MGHTTPPLRIGYSGSGSVNHRTYEIELDETVPVIVNSDCSVRFKKHDTFKIDKDYKGGDTDEWIPSIRQNVTVKYRICPFKGTCSPWSIENTYSIKIGSGSRQKSKKKSKGEHKRRPKRKLSSQRRK
jgi:hypothetical protein